MPKFLKHCASTIESATWLILHVLAHVLLVLGAVTTLLDKGIAASLVAIRQIQDGLIQRIGAK